MSKKSIAEKRAELEAQLEALKIEEQAEHAAYLTALGAGLQSALNADPNLKHTVMQAIEIHHKNNKHRELLGFNKIATNRGRPKAEA